MGGGGGGGNYKQYRRHKEKQKVKGGRFREEHFLPCLPSPPSLDYQMSSLSRGAKKVRILANKL